MLRLIADSGSTKTAWALVDEQPGLPKVIQTAQTQGLNPLYVSSDDITTALQTVLVGLGNPRPDELCFYGSGCSGERVALVEQSLRRMLTPLTRVIVQSDLVGAAKALSSQFGATDSSSFSASPFIACILGTGAIAALYDPSSEKITPQPSLGYILGDEGGGAWFGKHLLSDYLKGQMPTVAREAFEDDFGIITPEQAIRHVYQMPCPNRYLATLAAFLKRHEDLRYAQELSYRGIDAFWRRNVMRVEDDVLDVRLVGSVAYYLDSYVRQVADYHGYVVTRILKDPIEGLV